MKIIVIGLDGAAHEILFKDERLTNFRRLMDFGCYGQLESTIPATSIPGWMCMTTSQDPGSLGVYGPLIRADYSYNNFRIVTSDAIKGIAVWDQVARAGKQSIVIGVPPSYPPLKVNGIFVGYYPKPETNNTIFTSPEPLKEEIAKIVGEYPVELKDSPTDRKDRFKDDIYKMSRKQFRMIQHLMQNYEWDYFQFVDVGLDSLQHAFWQFHDPRHILYEPGNPYENVIVDYYLYLDDELGKILDLLDDDTAILIVSCHSAQRVDAGVCISEWLVKEGLLVLKDYSKGCTFFNKENINWDETKAWSVGGQYGYIFLNVKGREPRGTIDRADLEKFRNEIKVRLEESLPNNDSSVRTVAFKPDEIYKSVCNIPPDLIIEVGRVSAYSAECGGSLNSYTRENLAGQAASHHKQFGGFILAAPNRLFNGEVERVNLLDLAPTVLDLGGYNIPVSMQGKPLVADKLLPGKIDADYSPDDESVIRDRLKGLGYI